MRKMLLVVLTMVFMLIPIIAMPGEVSLTSDGKVPGTPFKVLQDQIDQLKSQLLNIQLTPGPQGIQGIAGVQGEKGDKGDQGIQGIAGLSGEQGTSGVVRTYEVHIPAIGWYFPTKDGTGLPADCNNTPCYAYRFVGIVGADGKLDEEPTIITVGEGEKVIASITWQGMYENCGYAFRLYYGMCVRPVGSTDPLRPLIPNVAYARANDCETFGGPCANTRPVTSTIGLDEDWTPGEYEVGVCYTALSSGDGYFRSQWMGSSGANGFIMVVK